MSHLTCPACGGHLTVIHAGLVETHARVPTLRRDDPWQTVRTLRLADFAACDRCEWVEELVINKQRSVSPQRRLLSDSVADCRGAVPVGERSDLCLTHSVPSTTS
jgi:hypothetical protein